MRVLKIKKLRENAKIPYRATTGSAGMDLYACTGDPVTIEPHQIAVIPTGIAIELESSDYVAYIFARSGLAIKHGLAPANCVGVIDSDYRGEILIALHNDTDTHQYVENGERVAQLVILPCGNAEFSEVRELSGTERGGGGFGSSGR